MRKRAKKRKRGGLAYSVSDVFYSIIANRRHSHRVSVPTKPETKYAGFCPASG